MPVARAGGQEIVDRYFDAEAGYWREVYERQDLQGLIYRRRMDTAMTWVQAAGLPAGARVLEVGAGAGLLCAVLARNGFEVTGTDSSPEMVELTSRQAGQATVGEHVRALLADAHSLPFGAGEFDLVVAIGLLPWLHDPSAAVAEFERVLKPGGWVIVTADNRARLNLLVEPREHPLLAPARLARRAIRRTRAQRTTSAPSHRHRPAEVDRMLESAGIRPVRRTTVGFGPFTFLGRPVLSDRVGLRLHAWLARLSEHRLPVLRRLGWHYVVGGRKP